MKFKFVYLLALSSLILATTAAYFSIVGMANLFVGAYWQVVIMITGLEIAKLVTSSFLYHHWLELNKIFRTSLTIAVGVLMIITSAGIYGFLSSAYSVTDDKVKMTDNGVIFLKSKKQNFTNNKQRFETTLQNKNNRIKSLINIRNNQEVRLDTLYKSNSFKLIKATEKIIEKTNLEIEKYNSEIDLLSSKMQINNDSISVLENSINNFQNNNTSSEISPLRYISKLTGKSIDSVVNFFILLLVFVFDPLALCLVIATNIVLVKQQLIPEIKNELSKNKPLPKLEHISNSIVEHLENEELVVEKKKDDVIERYLAVCKLAVEDEEVFNSFKTHPDYYKVLEHIPKRLGLQYLQSIRQNNPKMLNNTRIFDNDRLGSPKIEDFDDFNASSTTVQYIKTASDLRNRFDSLDDFDIVEIGGGYGGQAKILYDFWNIKSYLSIDLPEVILLQEKYVSTFKCVNFSAIDNTLVDYINQQYDLFISCYALTELTDEQQLDYVENVIVNCKRGYIVGSQRLAGKELLRTKSNFKIKAIDDKDFIITWGM